MKDSNVDLFDPRTIMDSDCLLDDGGRMPQPHQRSKSDDFGFAFDNSSFSDRVLRIEILPDLPESKSDADACTSIAEWARNRKRRREEIKKENGEDFGMQREEQILTCSMPDTDDVVAYENQDEEAVAMIEESPPCAGTVSCHLGTRMTSKF